MLVLYSLDFIQYAAVCKDDDQKSDLEPFKLQHIGCAIELVPLLLHSNHLRSIAPISNLRAILASTDARILFINRNLLWIVQNSIKSVHFLYDLFPCLLVCIPVIPLTC